jgi:hypothetical protein
LALSFLFIYSCSSAQNISGKSSEVFNGRKPSLKTLDIKGNIASSYQENENSALCRISISGVDSVSMSLIGPMGIALGRFFATPNYFLFFNAINNEAVEGSPNSENLQKAIMMPMSFIEFARLVRGETPGKPENFVPDTSSGKLKIYKNFEEKGFVEYVVLNDDRNIVQYQRKLRDGTLILNVFYSDYDSYDGIVLAKKINFEFPQVPGRIALNVDKYIVNDSANNKPYSFKVPDSIKHFRIE